MAEVIEAHFHDGPNPLPARPQNANRMALPTPGATMTATDHETLIPIHPYLHPVWHDGRVYTSLGHAITAWWAHLDLNPASPIELPTIRPCAPPPARGDVEWGAVDGIRIDLTGPLSEWLAGLHPGEHDAIERAAAPDLARIVARARRLNDTNM